MSSASYTSVPIRPETLRRLRAYKVGGSSYDDVLNTFMDDHPPEKFVQEHLRRLRAEERVSFADVKAKSARKR